jgi:hypothetical protein
MSPRLRSYNKRNEAVAALHEAEPSEAIALMLVAFYDLALEYCAGQGIPLSRTPTTATGGSSATEVEP